MGLIQHFPLAVTEQVVCLLASALATKISWDVPFEVADAAEMGPHTWGRSLRRVLRTPLDPRHNQFLTGTDCAGLLAVHIARARGGLVVGSVVAGDPSMAADIVLSEAERIVTAEASTPGSVTRLSLFDLPLGAGPVWDISEEPDSRPGAFMGDEQFTTIIPAWSAETNLNLGASPELGFEAAAGAIARALEMGDWLYDARQSAVAKYSRVGFEAAAVTAFAVARSAHVAPRRTQRRAVVRFAHPYAVVAATCNDPPEPSLPAWHGIPVFSAWVAEAENAATADIPPD